MRYYSKFGASYWSSKEDGRTGDPKPMPAEFIKCNELADVTCIMAQFFMSNFG